MRMGKITVVAALLVAAFFVSFRAGVVIHQLPIEWGVQPGDWLMITPIAFMGVVMLFVAYHLIAKAIKIIGN